MDFEEIKQILALVRDHELAEFELEHQGFKIRVRKDGATPPVPATPMVAPVVGGSVPLAVAAAAPAAPPAAETSDEPEAVELAVVKSPIVGTFYRSPEPEAKSTTCRPLTTSGCSRR